MDTTIDLPEILKKHAAWIKDEAGGVRADLSGANLSGANLSGADLSGADLSGADPPTLNFVRLPSSILAEQIILQAESGHLEMDKWHTCETTHCGWGWATTLNGQAGKQLENDLGIQAAGALLFPEFAPFVTESNERAMEELRRIAGQDGA